MVRLGKVSLIKAKKTLKKLSGDSPLSDPKSLIYKYKYKYLLEKKIQKRTI